jgi:hypothetical protein
MTELAALSRASEGVFSRKRVPCGECSLLFLAWMKDFMDCVERSKMGMSASEDQWGDEMSERVDLSMGRKEELW